MFEIVVFSFITTVLFSQASIVLQYQVTGAFCAEVWCVEVEWVNSEVSHLRAFSAIRQTVHTLLVVVIEESAWLTYRHTTIKECLISSVTTTSRTYRAVIVRSNAVSLSWAYRFARRRRSHARLTERSFISVIVVTRCTILLTRVALLYRWIPILTRWTTSLGNTVLAKYIEGITWWTLCASSHVPTTTSVIYLLGVKYAFRASNWTTLARFCSNVVIGALIVAVNLSTSRVVD
jgi:hypothetical protein